MRAIVLSALLLVTGCIQSDLHPIPQAAPQPPEIYQAPPTPVKQVVRRKPAPVVRPVAVRPVREPMPVIITPIERQSDGGWGGGFTGNKGAEWNPPTKYDHPYKGLLREYPLPQKQVVAACGKALAQYNIKATMRQRGCAVYNSDRSECTIIYIDKPFMGTTPEAVRRHEMGHCNGWAENHPD
jgi:hypothetical protein